MDLASDRLGAARHLERKYSNPPAAYLDVRRHQAGSSRPTADAPRSVEEDELSEDEDDGLRPTRDGRPVDGALLSQIQSRVNTLLPMLTSTSRTEHSSYDIGDPNTHPVSSTRDGNARFARAPSGFGRSRATVPILPTHGPRSVLQRSDSVMTASGSSMVSATSPSVGAQRQRSTQSEAPSEHTEGPYRRPGKHRVGESPTPEEYLTLPPEAKKKVDNRLSARRSRAKRKEHVEILTHKIAEQQNIIEFLSIENKRLSEHIASISRAGHPLHLPPFQPALVPRHLPDPGPHPRHLLPPPSHVNPETRRLQPVRPTPAAPGSPNHRSVPSPSMSTYPLASASGLVVAAAPPTGPGHVPILSPHGHPKADDGYMAREHANTRRDSPGRGTKREPEDERDDRLRRRMRYESPERSNWEHESEGRRTSHSSYQSPAERNAWYPATRNYVRSPSPVSAHGRRRDLPPSLAAPQYASSHSLEYDPVEDVGDGRSPISISGQGSVSNRLATLIRVHKRAIMTYRATRQGNLLEREERMEGLLGAAEAVGKDVEELTEEFQYVGRDGD